MLKKCFKQDFTCSSITLLIIVTPVLEVVGDLFQPYHADGFDMVQILNDCT